MNDIIDITPISLNGDAFNKTTNFGSGIELLMNDKKKEGNKPSSDINIDDLTNLENELNQLVDDTSSFNSPPSRNLFEGKSDMFSTSKNISLNFDDKPKHSVKFEGPTPNLGQSTSEGAAENKTWDGFSKFNDIPLNPDKPLPAQPQMSKDEMLREKFKYLRKLEMFESKGISLTKKYSMESPLAEMQGEYEMIMEEKEKQNSVKFQGNMLMACINAIEFLNNRFDPFDIKIDGWSEQVGENMTDYDDVFGELFEKYKSRASMAPELKLLFQLGGSAMMVHMTNTMFKSAMPGMDDILRQNPDLMRQFQTAAVNSMSDTSPGFSGFMNNVMNNDPQNTHSNLPPPMATQNVPATNNRPGNNNNFSYKTPSQKQNDGINIRENYAEASDDYSRRRPDMKGPSDISDLLSGLKTKTINIQESQINNDSTISISDLKDLQSDGNMPKKSKRRPKSDKNTISLDI